MGSNILPGSPCVAHCFPSPPLAGCHRTVLLQCGLPRTGHRGVAEPCDLFFALAPRSHDHQGDSRRNKCAGLSAVFDLNGPHWLSTAIT